VSNVEYNSQQPWQKGRKTMIAQSKKVASAALRMALSESREEEIYLKEQYTRAGIRTAAADYGGEFVSYTHLTLPTIYSV
jgi:hypothetical protein